MSNRPPTLRSRREIGQVFNRGRRSRGATLTVVALERGDQGESKVAYAVTRPRGAVMRNRIRRRLRSALVGADLKPGFDVVVVGASSAAEADFSELRAELWQKLDDLRLTRR